MSKDNDTSNITENLTKLLDGIEKLHEGLQQLRQSIDETQEVLRNAPSSRDPIYEGDTEHVNDQPISNARVNDMPVTNLRVNPLEAVYIPRHDTWLSVEDCKK
jgi:hypothetical protein